MKNILNDFRDITEHDDSFELMLFDDDILNKIIEYAWFYSFSQNREITMELNFFNSIQ
tara:strand:+ start:1073 stop:1246 length:174 start_codon:yes stop_codon:yes gene_type:complete